jgi:hypothetical protein
MVVYDHVLPYYLWSCYGRISPYPYTVVLVRIQRETEQKGDRMQSPFTKAVNDRVFVRISPYLSVYDTEIYDRNTITCKSSYFSVCGRLRPCLFDLGNFKRSWRNYLIGCSFFFFSVWWKSIGIHWSLFFDTKILW